VILDGEGRKLIGGTQNVTIFKDSVDTTLEDGSTIIEQDGFKEIRSRVPHPIPYRGSKRSLAPKILAIVAGKKYRRLYEPFAGSAAITIAAATRRIADEYMIGDLLEPLVGIWKQIVSSPDLLANAYEELWCGQLEGDLEYYNRVREEFNRSRGSASLLYLLTRCVKNALRFNQQGEFNQSHDKRRLGIHPNKMRFELLESSLLLAGRTQAICADFETTIKQATEDDLVYMDPPYEGTTTGTDKRYYQGLNRRHLIHVLTDLNRRKVPFLLSYDGRCGDKIYGTELPDTLNLMRLELTAGRSSQSTLSGRNEVTIESLYVSANLADGVIDRIGSN
jgi:DNA adenine methylase